MLSGIIMLSACSKESIAPTGSTAEETDMISAETGSEEISTDNTIATVALAESTAEETENNSAETVPVSTSEEECKNDIYTIVTDPQGCERVLYYLPSENGGSAFIYMSADVSDPEKMMGYVPALSENVPAVKMEMPFGKDLEAMLSKANYHDSYITYYVAENAMQFCPIDAEGDVLAGICRLAAAAEPEYISVPQAETAPDENGSEETTSLEASEDYYEYSEAYPVADVVLRSRMGSLSSVMIISFGSYNDRLAVKYHIEDYSALEKLAERNSSTEEELKAAYSSSFGAESEWFCSDSIEGPGGLYDFLMDAIENDYRNRT